MTYHAPTFKIVIIFVVFFYYPQTPWKRRRCIATCHPSRRSTSPATTACTVCRPRRLTPRKNRRRPHRRRRMTVAFPRRDSDRPPSRPARWPLRRRPRPQPPPPPPARTTDCGRSRASGRSASRPPARTSTSSAWASSDRPARKCSSNLGRRRSGDLTAPLTNSDRHTPL